MSYKVTNDKKTYSDCSTFLFSMHIKICKKLLIIAKIKHNGDLWNRDFTNYKRCNNI